MKKKEIINIIEQNLSTLLSRLDYEEYLLFIKNNKLITFYDSNIDKFYSCMIFSTSLLNVINETINNRIKIITK